jgi:hypothetical protein
MQPHAIQVLPRPRVRRFQFDVIASTLEGLIRVSVFAPDVRMALVRADRRISQTEREFAIRSISERRP